MDIKESDSGKVIISNADGMTVELMDITGIVLHTFTGTSHTQEIDLNPYCIAGVYFLKCNDLTYQIILE